MLYGKIINVEIVHAPENYESTVITIRNFNKDEKLMNEFGYKKIVEDGYSESKFAIVKKVEEKENVIIIHKVLDNSPEVLNNIKKKKKDELNKKQNLFLENQTVTFDIKGEKKEFSISYKFQKELNDTILKFIISVIPEMCALLPDGNISLEQMNDCLNSLGSISFLNNEYSYSELMSLKSKIEYKCNLISKNKKKLEAQIDNADNQIDLLNINLDKLITYTE